MMNVIIEKSESKVQLNRFYLFHHNDVYLPFVNYYKKLFRINEIEGNITPTQENNNRFLYHENIAIINDFYERLRTEPINVSLERLLNSNIEPNEAFQQILFPKLSCIENTYLKTANTLGKWMMFFKKEVDFDQKWLDCCKLYNENKLFGIVALMCTTDFYNEKHDRDIGVIFFYCESDDILKLAEYGINLLNYIPQASGALDKSNIYYKNCEYDKDNDSCEDGRENTIGNRKKPWAYKLNVNTHQIRAYEEIYFPISVVGRV